MPALVLLGQPTIVSGDDIRWICILLILLRLMQFACVIPYLAYVVNFHDRAAAAAAAVSRADNDYEESFEKCKDSTSLVSKAKEIAISYGVLTLILVVSSVILESFIWRTSLRGTPTEPEKRAALHYLCGIKLVPGSILRVVTMCMGITMTIILKDFCDCHFETTTGSTLPADAAAAADDHSPDLLLRDLRCGSKFPQVRMLLVILVISHMTEVCCATLMYGCILFQSLRGKQHLFRLVRWIQTLGGLRGSASNDSPSTGRHHDGSGWQCFLSCCFTLTSLLTCCMLGGTKAATADFGDISRALVMFLDDGGYLDITISDVLAALVVLHKQHQEERDARIHRIQSQIHLHVGDASTSTNRTTNPNVNNPPSGTQNLGTGCIDENEQVDVEAVFRSASSDCHEEQHHQSLQQLLKDDRDHENENDIERQESRRNPTMFRWTLQREADHSNSSSRDDVHQRPQHRGLHHTSLPAPTASAHYERNERAILMPTDPSAKDVMATGAHFMRLALAVYGPFFNVAAKPCQCSLCCLGVDACLFPCRRTCGHGNGSGSSTNNHGDNLCGCNANALLREANLSMEDVAYADFHSDVDKNPYAIIIDRPWKSIVVAIRGSLTLESIVTDLALIPARLDTVVDDLLAGDAVIEEATAADDDVEKNDSTEFGPAAETAVDADDDPSSHVYCHSGMLKTAQWIYSDLQRHGILNRLLLDDNAPYADYQLVFTGHSLGAGLSAILGIMLRPKFPTLKCICFSPPGGTMSENALTASKALTAKAVMDDATSRAHGDHDFITSYLVGSDIIPRMSLESMEALRDDVLEMVARIKVNKVQVMRSGDEVISQLIHGEGSIPRTKFQQQLLGFWAHQSSLRDTRPTGNSVKLYPPPGRIVHFVKTTTKSSRPSAHGIRAAAQAAMTTTTTTTRSRLSSSYTAIWAERQDLSEIQLSASMMSDHFPWTSLDIMEQIASDDFGLSEPYFLPA